MLPPLDKWGEHADSIRSEGKIPETDEDGSPQADKLALNYIVTVPYAYAKGNKVIATDYNTGKRLAGSADPVKMYDSREHHMLERIGTAFEEGQDIVHIGGSQHFMGMEREKERVETTRDN